MYLNKLLLLAVITILIIPELKSEVSPEYNESFAIHPRLGIVFNQYKSSFTDLQGPSNCGLFTNGSGIGLSGQLGFEFPIFTNTSLSISLGYTNRSGSLKNQGSYPYRDSVSGDIIKVITENEISAKLGYLSINPEIYGILANKFIDGPLRYSFGLNISFPLIFDYVQSERIVSPLNITFNDNGKKVREHLLSSGTLRNITKPLIGLAVGIENNLKTGNNNFFTQQLLFEYFINNVIADKDFKIYSLKLNLGYRFSFRKINSVKEDTLTIKNVPIIKDTQKIIVEKPKEPQPILDLQIKSLNYKLYTGVELLASLPLVNAVFFDRNSSDIQQYYLIKEQILPEFYIGDGVDVHKYSILRIAKILKDNPNSTLTLSGATSGMKNEPSGLKLAKERADNVERVFINLGISKKRIKVTTSEFPKYMSNQDFELGQIENQRVDMFVEDAPLQEYVSLQRFKELRGNAYFITNAQNIKYNSKLIFSSNLEDNPRVIKPNENINLDFVKRISDNQEKLLVTSELVYDSLIKTASISKDIDHKDTNLVELGIDRFDAVLRFDYNSSILTTENKDLLNKLVEMLPSGIKIVVAASADALGTTERNIILTKERTENTYKYLVKISKGKNEVLKTTNFNKYSEETQQGRFINRSLRIRLTR